MVPCVLIAVKCDRSEFAGLIVVKLQECWGGCRSTVVCSRTSDTHVHLEALGSRSKDQGLEGRRYVNISKQ